MVTIRASSFPELFDCPARWEAKHVNHMRLPSSSNAMLGKAVHAGTALFDASALMGEPVSIDDAAGVLVDAIHHPDEEVEWGEARPQDVEKIALALHRLYCRQVAPSQSYVAVEATCERLEITDLDIALTGTTDRVAETAHGYGVADIKTGENAVSTNGSVETKRHAAQVAVYELLAEQSTGIPMTAPSQVIGLQVAKTDKGRRAGIGIVEGGRELLIGDGESPGLLHHAASMVHSGSFFGNPRSMMCDKKYCPIHPRCRWRR